MEFYTDIPDNKSFYEMDNRELFCTLTGDRGIVAQNLRLNHKFCGI